MINMLCYRDMTFCPFWHDCHNAHSCERRLTPDILEAAAKCGLGICEYTKEPHCYKEIENETTQTKT